MERKNKKRILFVYKKFTTFVGADYDFLKREFKVKRFSFYPFSNFMQIGLNLIRQFFFMALNIMRVDIIYIWFADYHAFSPVFFARLFKKKSIVVIGGFDVNIVSEINYGALKHPWRAKMVKFVLSNASFIIPVAKELAESIKQINPQATVKAIPTGYDPMKWTLNNNESKKYLVTTVSVTNDKKRFLVKGLDRFIELTYHFPNEKFCIVGADSHFIRSLISIPGNLEILPPLSQNSLNEVYGDSEYYAQFSRSEGLPNAICEAMLCGCIPLGTNVGGIKSLIIKHGLVINHWEPIKIVNYIKDQSISSQERKNCRNHIIENYSFRKREIELSKLIRD